MSDRIVEVGSSTGKVHYTIAMKPVTAYFPDAGSTNHLMGGLPTGGQVRDTGTWTIEIQHVSGAKIWHAGCQHTPIRLARELDSALALLEGWKILSDSDGLLV